MKRTLTLCAAAVLCACAASAQAADVRIYGVIDTGLVFQGVDPDVEGSDRNNSVKMNSSVTGPNRWGLEASETLGNGWTAGFNLEGQFGSDDGSMTNSRLFQRMSQVWIGSDTWGKLMLGRSGQLRSGMGTTGIWGPKLAPFSNSWGDYLVGSKYIMPGVFGGMDNTITWQSPVWAGAQLHLQYSAQMNSVTATDDMEEFENSSDRNWGIGLTYTNGALHLAAVVDSVMYSDTKAKYDDSLMVSLGGAYDFSFVKVYASGAWFSDMKGSSFLGHGQLNSLWGVYTEAGAYNGVEVATYKGYSLQLGVDVPMGPGTFKANVGWMDAQADHQYVPEVEVLDTDRIGFGIGYTLPLSKRTNLYAGAGYTQDTSSRVQDSDPNVIEAMLGMMHKF